MLQQTTKNRIVFWSRMTGWIGTSCVIPVAVFASKFGLFKQSGYKVTTDELGNITSVTPTALNGWGIISCFLVCWTLIQILKEVRDAYTGYSLTKQCIDGFISSIMPLIIMFGVCYFLRGVIDEILYCLGIIIICKVCSVPLNPLPKWKYDKLGTEDYSDAFTSLVKILKNKTSKGGE